MKKLVMTISKVGISALIMFLLLRGMDLVALKDIMLSISPGMVATVVGLLICIQLISTLRWSIILKMDLDIPYIKLLAIYLVGMFFNNFLPTIVGGDLIKGYYLYKETGKGGHALASVFLDRYTGLAALMCIALAALFLGHRLLEGTGLILFFVLLVLGFVGASLVIWVDMLHTWAMKLMAKIHFYGINKKIDKFYNVLMSYRHHHGIIGKAFLCSFFVQGGVITVYFLLGRGLGIDIPMVYFYLFVPLATVASMLPISLAGLGVREGIFVFLFAKAGVSKELAIGLSLLFFFISVAVSLIGGVLYIRMGGKKDMPPEVEEEAAF